MAVRPISPSYVARSQAVAKLAAVFNDNYAAVLETYPGAQPTSIDFGPTSLNFYLGRLDLADLIETSPSKFPMMTVYALANSNQNTQKFQKFSGLVRVGIETHLSYKAARALRNYEAWPDAVEHAMLQTFNDGSAQVWATQLVYNGLISIERRPIVKGAENWLQTVYTQLTFEAVIQ